MSLRNTFAIIIALQMGMAEIAFASLPSSDGAHPYGNMKMSTLSPGTVASRAQLMKNQWYALAKTSTLTVFDDQTGKSPNVNAGTIGQIGLVEGLEVNVMDISQDGQFVQIGIDDDVVSEMNPQINPENPVLVWVDADELLRTGMQIVDIEGQELLADMLQTKDAMDYANTDLAARNGGHARRRGHRGHGKMTYCLRDVRLTAAKYTSNVPSGIEAAARAYPYYKAAGWRPVSYSASAEKGTACFFGGGRKGCHGYCGHAAIKIGANAWKGAGVRPTPFIAGRTLIGCLVPPGH